MLSQSVLKPTSSKSNVGKGFHNSKEIKEVILRVFQGIQKDFPDWTKSAILSKTAEYTGVCTRTIERYIKEEKSTKSLEPPKKIQKKNPPFELTDHHKYLIRRTVHSFFMSNKIPTVDAVHAEVARNTEIPQMSRSKLYSVLKELNFKYSKRKRNSILIERPDITMWRRKFLRRIKKAREDGKKIFYLDETWVNAGHTKEKVWHDESIKSARDAQIAGLSTGLKNPSGKGKRLIVLHIGSYDGFLEDGLLLFEGTKTGDYHCEMNSDCFEEWFAKILEKVPENSVIVLDNASYHSRVCEKNPTSSWRKKAIQDWLDSKGISWDDSMIKRELLELVTASKPVKKYVVDEMAAKKNVTVIRLPPYHCEFNPIELIWAFIKNDVAANNTTFKFNEMRQLFTNALSKVTPELWQESIRHVIDEEAKMWKLDGMMENTIDEVIINLDNDSSSDWTDESDKEN